MTANYATSAIAMLLLIFTGRLLYKTEKACLLVLLTE